MTLMANAVALIMSAETEDLLEDQFKKNTERFMGENPLRQRFLMVDEYIQRECAKSATDAKGKFANRYLGDRSKLQNFEVPVIQPKLESAAAFYSSTFLTGYPIISAVATQEYVDVAAQFHAMMARDQATFDWTSNLLQVHKDALKYNIYGAEVKWHRQFVTKQEQGKQPQQVVSKEGMRVTRMDPYNMIFDLSTAPSKMASEGAFFGWVERKNYVATKDLVGRLDNNFKLLSELKEAFKNECNTDGSSALYYEPKLRKLLNTGGQDKWTNYFGMPTPTSMSNTQGIYEVTHMYMRIIPKEFKIKAPNAGSPQVFYTIFLNQDLVYLQPLAGEEEFPIAMGMLTDEGLGFEIKSFAENLMDSQDISSALINGRLASLRRSVGDRAIYDPKKIRSTDINSANPEAKIPAKIGAQESLASAYYQIPYRDDMAQSFVQEFMLQQQFAEEISGINKAFQGNFVKGNRTLSEFDTIMQNAQARTAMGALILSSQLYHNMQEKLENGYLTFATAGQALDPKTKQAIPIDPQQLQEAKGKIRLTNGMNSNAKLMNQETLQLAFQGFSTIPDFGATYDAAGMFVYMLKNMGFGDLDDFKRAQGTPAGTPAQPAPASGGATNQQ